MVDYYEEKAVRVCGMYHRVSFEYEGNTYDRVYVCEKDKGHDGHHRCEEMMW